MTETENKGLLSSLIGDVKVNTSVTQSDLMRIGLTLFVAACLIMVAWFTFKKVFN